MEQVGTDVSNKTAAVNLTVATQLSDRILGEVTDALKVTVDQLVSSDCLLSYSFFCYFYYVLCRKLSWLPVGTLVHSKHIVLYALHTAYY